MSSVQWSIFVKIGLYYVFPLLASLKSINIRVVATHAGNKSMKTEREDGKEHIFHSVSNQYKKKDKRRQQGEEGSERTSYTIKGEEVVLIEEEECRAPDQRGVREGLHGVWQRWPSQLRGQPLQKKVLL